MVEEIIKWVQNLCLPAQINLGLIAIASIIRFLRRKEVQSMTKKQYNISMLEGILYGIFSTWILGQLCDNGYGNTAWFILLLPAILLFAGFFMLFLAVGH
jgi:hypothetical protein